MTQESTVTRQRGLRHLAMAPLYSLGGLKRLASETAFRHELLALAASLLLFAALGAGLVSYMLLLAVFLLVAALEALNTAIEEIVDRVSPERSHTARHAKDLGSLAVFCGLCIWALLVVYVTSIGLGLF